MKNTTFSLLILFVSVFASKGQVLNLHSLNKGITATVNDKSLGPNKTWVVYADPEMDIKLGKLSASDTVLITGWSTWTFYIETKSLKGYISWLALNSNIEIDLLSSMIKSQSEIDDKKNRDSILFPVQAFLQLSATKNEVYVGECFSVYLEFGVYDWNKALIQFHDLGSQLFTSISKSLYVGKAWSTGNFIRDVAGLPSKNIGGHSSMNYRLFHSSYCPASTEDVYFPEVELKIAKLNRGRKLDKLVAFKSKALSVKVKPLPNLMISSYDHYKLVGNFNLTDSLATHKTKINTPVDYFVTISGEGLTYPIIAPQIKIPGVVAILSGVIDSDTIIQQKYLTSKLIHYKLVFTQPGTYDLNGKINFSYFNPTTLKQESLKSQNSIRVSSSDTSKLLNLSKLFYSKENLILIDGSQSMLLEDYSPNRLSAVTIGLKKFLVKKTICDIGLIEFAGYPQFVNISKEDSCYSGKLLDTIRWMNASRARGTAIGEAVFFAKNYLKETTKTRKLVVIGDGDNTSGNISPEFAATIAKEHDIKIYSIGVGHGGLVRYGRDPFGRPQMVNNTFSDSTLKEIAKITGGEYFWANDSDDLFRILKKIFP